MRGTALAEQDGASVTTCQSHIVSWQPAAHWKTLPQKHKKRDKFSNFAFFRSVYKGTKIYHYAFFCQMSKQLFS